MLRFAPPLLALFAAALPAQGNLVCDQPVVALRPGERTCVTVRTVPATPGVTITPQFNIGIVQVSPGTTATTGPTGEARFIFSHGNVSLLGTSVFFHDPSTVFASCQSDVVCDYGKITLRGEAGSYPGRFALEIEAAPAVQPGQFGVILLSPTFGTIPLATFNFLDPRELSLGPVGLTLPAGFGGAFAAPFTRFATPPLTLGALPGNATIYAQAVVLGLSAPLFQRLSQPQPIYLAPADTFQNRFKQMTMVRSFFPVIETGDQRVMAIGGGAGGIFSQIATDACDVYDPFTDTWSQNPTSMTAPRSLHTATRLPNGKWLIVGGVDDLNDPQSSAEIYDPATNTFTAVGSMASVRVGHSATLLPGGQVLIAGGLSVIDTNIILTIVSSLDSTEVFTLDPSGCSGSFTPGPKMANNRAGHTAIALSDGRVLVAGGIGHALGIPSIWDKTELYGGASFTAGPVMPTQRALSSLVQIGNAPDRYLLAGGLNSVLGAGAPTDRADVYTANPNQPGSWARAGNMSTVRGIQAAYRFGDEVIQIGGLKGNLIVPESQATTDVYHIPTGTWSTGPNLSTERGAYGSYLDPYGVVHIMGGATGPGQYPSVSDSTEWYHR